ncbi:MAG: hypothetical protein ACRDLD_04035 [Thermoleophilaceae bacterium]
MTDDRGVLENLPRSRPGRRSEKRAGSEAAEKRAGREAAAARPSSASTPRRRPRPTPPDPPAPASRDGDPIGEAIRTVAGIAATGARVANGVARGVLRRLPRP